MECRWDSHEDGLAVPGCLVWDAAYYAARQIHVAPCQCTAVAKTKPRASTQVEQKGQVAFSLTQDRSEFGDGKFPAAMYVQGAPFDFPERVCRDAAGLFKNAKQELQESHMLVERI